MIVYLFLSSYMNKRPHLKGWHKAIKFLFGVWVFFSGTFVYNSLDYSYTDRFGNTYVATEKTYFLKADRLEIAKFNDSGSLRWSKKHNLGSVYPTQILGDESGNIYIALSCEPGSLVVKFDAKGNLLWERKTSLDIKTMRIIGDRLTAIGYNSNYRLAVEDFNISRGLLTRAQIYPQWPDQGFHKDVFCIDRSGNIFTFMKNNSILNKMTPEGQCQWEIEIDDSIFCFTLNTDVQNNLYLGGVSKKLDRYTEPAYLTKIDCDGKADWSQEINLGDYLQYTSLERLDITGDNSLYAIGEHQYAKEGQAFFGSSYKNISKLFLMKMTLDGQLQWHILIDLPSNSYFGTDDSGNVYLVSEVSWTDSLGLIKYDAKGERQWMSVTLSVDRIYTILMVIVGIMGSVIEWRAKHRKKTRINPYTGALEKCYEEYPADTQPDKGDYCTDNNPT